MDEDMEAVEIVFAQRMASCDPVIRKRALKNLQQHIKEQSARNGFSLESLSRLCKGLHYALWMQDKMLLQEELADEICALIEHFCAEEHLLAFVKAVISTLSKEWPNIDKWRMDKFLMLVRRLVRKLLNRLASKDWNETLVEKYLHFFRETLISPKSPICDSLKYHFSSLWLDELDNASAGALDTKRSIVFIRPYIELLREKISDTYFRSVCTDVFDAMLCDFSERLNERAEENEELEEGEKSDGGGGPIESASLGLDYGRIGELLFDVGKHKDVTSKRRKRIYALCKKFQSAAKGIDPLEFEVEAPIEKNKRWGKRGRMAAGE